MFDEHKPLTAENGRIRILFDGPPSPDETGRFVEAEDENGCGINAGEWTQEGEFWVLTIVPPVLGNAERDELRAEVERLKEEFVGLAEFRENVAREREEHERKLAAVREWAERTGANYAASHERRMGYTAAQNHVQNILNDTALAPQWTSEPSSPQPIDWGDEHTTTCSADGRATPIAAPREEPGE